MIAYFKDRTKKSIPHTVFLCAVAAACLSIAVYFAVRGAFRNMVLAIFCAALIFPGLTFAEYILRMTFAPVFTLLITLLFMGGLVLGPGLDFYFRFPHWDDILHTASGLIFASLGYTFADGIVSRDLRYRKFLCICVGVSFSLAIALLWEMFEYAGTTFLGMDMQEDTIIYNIRSFLLAGSHNDIVEINGITQTIIYYGDGQQYVIDGYLDIGLYDTLNDMLVCLIGALALPVLIVIGSLFGKKPEKFIVPQWDDRFAQANAKAKA